MPPPVVVMQCTVVSAKTGTRSGMVEFAGSRHQEAFVAPKMTDTHPTTSFRSTVTTGLRFSLSQGAVVSS